MDRTAAENLFSFFSQCYEKTSLIVTTNLPFADWPQIFADCLGVPISVAEAGETGALGAAIGAGIGGGLFADYEEGVARMTRIRQVFEPDMSMKSHYDIRYRTYRDLAGVLTDFWRRHNAAGSR